MRIRVRDSHVHEGMTCVDFTSPSGEGSGRWQSAHAPDSGSSCDVEFDVEGAIEDVSRVQEGEGDGFSLRAGLVTTAVMSRAWTTTASSVFACILTA